MMIAPLLVYALVVSIWVLGLPVCYGDLVDI